MHEVMHRCAPIALMAMVVVLAGVGAASSGLLQELLAEAQAPAIRDFMLDTRCVTF